MRAAPIADETPQPLTDEHRLEDGRWAARPDHLYGGAGAVFKAHLLIGRLPAKATSITASLSSGAHAHRFHRR
ncbi:hypothetical protein [Actinoplanes sp. GCM10030250]|uniref:hypothetical protein n=1 Tax=Actinoplanes sp. GCM10030250 TaxID=3273376 RepID=UPI00361CF138